LGGGADEGGITISTGDVCAERDGNEGRGGAHIGEVDPRPVDGAGSVVGKSPVNFSIDVHVNAGKAGGATKVA